tara:strand:- start:2194 stop:2562 length:369 start_codon:yes stop_codon:yes gene_type:complete
MEKQLYNSIKDCENEQQEYETRKLIFHFEFPAWVEFKNLPTSITGYPRYWWMTAKQFHWFYSKYFKSHENFKSFSKPYVKYSNPTEVENCKSGIDRNIKHSDLRTEASKRRDDYRYLSGGFY